VIRCVDTSKSVSNVYSVNLGAGNTFGVVVGITGVGVGITGVGVGKRMEGVGGSTSEVAVDCARLAEHPANNRNTSVTVANLYIFMVN